jgi:hypothetical protein
MRMNRVAINIVVLLVLVGGFLGYRLYQAESDRATISKEFDVYRQEQTTRLSAAEAALKADQERIAEEEKKAADAEQRRKVEEQRRMAVEEQLRRQDAVRKAGGDRDLPQIADSQPRTSGGDERRPGERAGDRQVPGPQSDRVRPDKPHDPYVAGRESQADRRSVSIKTRINSQSAAQVPLARVHAGDHVTIRIKRIGKADRHLLVGLGPAVRDSMGAFPDGPLIGPRIVGKRIKDEDRFSVTHDLLSMGGPRFNLNTERGAILYLGTGSLRPPYAESYQANRTGYYEVEIEIRENNRWALIPESLA